MRQSTKVARWRNHIGVVDSSHSSYPSSFVPVSPLIFALLRLVYPLLQILILSGAVVLLGLINNKNEKDTPLKVCVCVESGKCHMEKINKQSVTHGYRTNRSYPPIIVQHSLLCIRIPKKWKILSLIKSLTFNVSGLKVWFFTFFSRLFSRYLNLCCHGDVGNVRLTEIW